MKKVSLLALSLLAISGITYAQQNPMKHKMEHHGGKHQEKLTPEQRAQKHVDRLNQEVSLTEDQKSKVYELALAKAKKVDEARTQNQSADKGALKKQMKSTQNDFHEELKSILTPEQLATLKAKHQEMKKKGKPTSFDQE